MWTRPAAYYELLDRSWWTTKSGKIITVKVLRYWHCSPKLLGCHTLSVPHVNWSYSEWKTDLHFQYIILAFILYSFRCVFGDGQNRTDSIRDALAMYTSCWNSPPTYQASVLFVVWGKTLSCWGYG